MCATIAELEELYHAKYFGFRNALAAVTGDHDSAHDAVQEAFARAVKERESFRGDGTLAGWVWRIAFRCATHSVRHLHLPLEPEPDLSLPEPHVAPELAVAIRRLPPRQRLFVFLRYFAELEYTEIAEACDVSVGTVGAALTQARGTLRRSLASDPAIEKDSPTIT